MSYLSDQSARLSKILEVVTDDDAAAIRETVRGVIVGVKGLGAMERSQPEVFEILSGIMTRILLKLGTKVTANQREAALADAMEQLSREASPGLRALLSSGVE